MTQPFGLAIGIGYQIGYNMTHLDLEMTPIR